MMSEVLIEVKKAEAEAAQILEKAQAKVEDIQRDAQRTARKMEQNIQAELSEEINALRKTVETKANTKARQILSNADKEIAVLEEQGKKNMKKTLVFIIQAVYTYGATKK
jgi:vacuolar-type H+-ATPase subunit H